jgi:hypothetical protein
VRAGNYEVLLELDGEYDDEVENESRPRQN